MLILHLVICEMSSVKCQLLMLILGTCWTTFVFMSMLKSGMYVKCELSIVKYGVASGKCQMLMLILGTCWTTFVSCLCSKVAYVKCQVSNVKCLCWSLGHAEQFLFSCLCSNVDVYGWKWQWFFFDLHTLSCDWTNHRAGSQLKKCLKVRQALGTSKVVQLSSCDVNRVGKGRVFLAGNQLYELLCHRKGCCCCP